MSKPRQTAPNPHKLQCHWWKGGKATTTHLVIVSKDGKSTKRQNRQNSRDNEQEAETFLEALKGVGQVAVSAPIDQRYEHPQHQARLVQGKTADGLAERTPSCDPCSGCKFTWCLHNVTPVRPASPGPVPSQNGVPNQHDLGQNQACVNSRPWQWQLSIIDLLISTSRQLKTTSSKPAPGKR